MISETERLFMKAMYVCSHVLGKNLGVILAILLALQGAGCQDDPSAAFHAARDRYIQGDFSGAVAGMDAFLNRFQHRKLERRAWFIKGKAQMGMNDLEAASTSFQRVIDLASTSLEADKARYKLVFIDELQGKLDEAIKGYQRIANQASVMRGEAQARLRAIREYSPQ
jgi:TolA-binding protein